MIERIMSVIGGSFAHHERGKEEEEKKETEISQMEKGIQKKAK